jgi:hypothetical protein
MRPYLEKPITKKGWWSGSKTKRGGFSEEVTFHLKS